MRGVKGAEKYVLDAIRRCNERGFSFTASMSLCRDNRDSIRETVKLMGELGCRYLKICNTSPQGEWKDQPEHYLKQTEAYQTFLDYIPQYFGRAVAAGVLFELRNEARRKNAGHLIQTAGVCIADDDSDAA